MAILDGDIRKVAEQDVVGVVLFGCVVDVSIVLVNLVVANESLEEQESVVVFMRPARGIEEDSYIGVDHLIIPHEHKSWGENSFLLVARGESSRGIFRKSSKVFVAEVNELSVIDLAGTYDDHIAAVVVVGMELSDHIFSDIVNVLSGS